MHDGDKISKEFGEPFGNPNSKINFFFLYAWIELISNDLVQSSFIAINNPGDTNAKLIK